jgi:hypothetical protein
MLSSHYPQKKALPGLAAPQSWRTEGVRFYSLAVRGRRTSADHDWRCKHFRIDISSEESWMQRMRGGSRNGAGRPMGANNKRTVAVEQAMQVVAEKLKEAMPGAFDGDGVAFMQSVYSDPSFPVELRLDATSKAARFERPALGAVLTKDVSTPSATSSTVNISQRINELLGKARGEITTGEIR